ncbi:MAG: hypothetical protein WC732_03240 [Candidatus Omnitrophota bacterium]
MNKTLVILMVIAVVSMAGCAKKASSSSEAIAQAQTMQSVNQKVDYLAGQANMFLDSREYSEALKTANYILSNVDSNSQQAKDIVQKAQERLSGQVKDMAGNFEKSMSGMGQ